MIKNPALGSFGNQTGEQFLAKLMPALVSLLLVVGIVSFLYTFLIGGIKYITAGGDKGKTEEAKQSLTNALIGLVILLMFFGILSLVECFFGIGLRQITIGPFNVAFTSVPACQGFTSN